MAQVSDLDQLPLKGVVLCCTSLTQDVRVRNYSYKDVALDSLTDDILLKTKSTEIAIQMGAIHKLDLTSDVTHLLVGDITTAKCRYVAKERPDVRVLFPEFIDAVRDLWVQGGDVEVEALEKHYTIPPFHGLHICLTGFQNMEQRKEMENAIIANGGSYHADLTKKVTHLIAKQPEGAKYTHGKQWGIRVVGEKWYGDCLMRGMTLDESFYPAELPLDRQGVGAFRKEPRRTSLGKRTREGEQVAEEDFGRRKLRKTASMRLDAHSQELWRDVSTNEVQVETTELDAWTNESQALTGNAAQRPDRQPQISKAISEETGRERPLGLFSGHYLFICGFDSARTRKLRQFLEPNGACVVDSADQLEGVDENHDFQERCLVIPHDRSTKLPALPTGTVIVTEWWVERCIHFKRNLDPEEDYLSSPLSDASVPGFKQLTVSTTGLTGVDLRQTAEAVKLMGATYQEKLLASTSILVCASNTVKKEKAFYAAKHGIPVVSIQWLWASLKTKGKASVEEYLMKLPAFDSNEFNGNPSTSSLASTRDTSQPQRLGESTKKANDPVPPKRLSNTRKRHATPSLMLKASKATPSEAKTTRMGPFVVDDDDDYDDAAPPALSDNGVPPMEDYCALPSDIPRPLREISPNLSQQRSTHSSLGLGEDIKQCEKSTEGKKSIPSPQSSPKRSQANTSRSSSGVQSARPMRELTSDLADILARRVGNTSDSVAPEPTKRKHRPLGRNLSGIAHRAISTATSLSTAEAPKSISPADGYCLPHESPAEAPSTQLGYQTPDAAARRIAGTGTVKDSADVAAQAKAAAVGGRGRGRNRGKA